MPSSKLPDGYKTVDKTTVRGRLKNASPLDKGLRSLLVKDTTIRNEKEAEDKIKPPVAKVKSLSDIISNNIQASNDLRTITHYIKRAEQIWTTLLLKPNGDQPDLLIYDSKQSDVKNAKLHELLLTVVKNHFTTKYPFEEIIPQIIKDVMFRTGSYALVHLSHSVLDHLINGMEVPLEEGEKKGEKGNNLAGMESMRSITDTVLRKHFVGGNWGQALNLGYIRKTRNANPGSFIGFESLYTSGPREPEYHLVDPSLKWTFTDNPMVIKAGELAQKLREDRLRQMTGNEGLDNWITNRYTKSKGKKKTNNNNLNIVSKQTLEEEIKSMYPDRNYDENETLSVRKGKFYSGNGRGIGITYHWPSEAIINVCLNGDVGKPFGHILLSDPETGEPLKNTSDVKFYQKSPGSATEQKPMTGSMNEIISHIRSVAAGSECEHDMSWMIEMASANLEKEFIEGLLNGDLKKDVSITLTEENKKLYMSRALRDQGVRAIFVPAEYVTYIALDFSKLGVGKSLIDEAKLHITRLAVLDTADALAQVENSISHTLMTIDPEDEDFDVRNTVAMLRDEYFANNPTLHDILGYNNVSIDAVLDRFKEQTLTIKVNPGDNPNIVAPQIEANQMNREPLKSIDRDTREGLLNTISGMFGLKRSWLDDVGEGNDFAVEALAEQELLRNQTNDYSRTFSKFFTDTMRKYMRVNEPLIGELIDTIKENKKLYMKPDQTGELEIDEELKEKLAADSADEDEEISAEEMDVIKVVLTDFLNTFFVTLPTPAITDSLNKLDDKLATVEKLVANWFDLGGGAAMLKKRAEDAGMDADAVIGSIKAVILNEAFQRFNLPMPFESILNDGSNGGILNMVNNAADLENNVLRFLTEWLKGTKKNRGMLERLKAKVEKEEGLEPQEVDNPGMDVNGENTNYDIENLPEPQMNPGENPEETPPEETPPEEQVETQTSEQQELEQQANEDGTAPADKADDIWANE